MSIKFKYVYGIPEKPETYHSRVFTLNEIESGSQFDYISDSPFWKEHRIIGKFLCSNFKDAEGTIICEGDIIIPYCYKNAGETFHFTRCQVVFTDSMLTFKINSRFFSRRTSLWEALKVGDVSSNSYLIIGNSCQNPEMWED